MTPEQRLEALGLTLPAMPIPVANYVPYRWAGNLLYLSGQGPKRADGTSDADWKKQQEAYQAELAKFIAHTHLSQWPKFWDKQGRDSGSVNTVPWVLQVVCNLIKHGIEEQRAWEMPESQAVWMSTGFNSIGQGGSEIQLLTTEEEEFLDQSARVGTPDGPQT